MEHNRFGRIVKQRRKALDLTQDDLARLVGCAVVTIQKIEEGRRRPSKHVAALLADHLTIAEEEREMFLRLARGMPIEANVQVAKPSQDSTPPRLPTPLTPLIGRASEVAAVCNLLDDPAVRLVTLIGPPGVGKTRLSLQVAADLHVAFADGVWFVPLAPISDVDLVLPMIMEALELGGVGAQRAIERLKATLRAKQMLVVLDNFEHVVEAAPSVTELLVACPHLKVLTTSRIPLHVYGEHEYAVAPFAVPEPALLSAPERLKANEAVRLFIARVQAFKPRFVLQLDNAQAIIEICAQLDGLPLAIELAAARVRQFTPDELAAQLRHADNNPLPMLSGGPRDLPARQQTLERAIAWSYDLLPPDAQALFARLSVFVGDFTLDAAESIGNIRGESAIAVRDSLHRLLDHSLVQPRSGSNQATYFTLLQTIRVYAGEHLHTSGMAEPVHRAHADYYLALAEQAARALEGPKSGDWLRRLDAVQDNLRAALSWSLEHGETTTALRLGGALGMYWHAYGYLSEGRRWLEAALGTSEPPLDSPPDPIRARALLQLGGLILRQGEPVTARPLLESALTGFRTVGNKTGMARALLSLAMASTGDNVVVRTLQEEALHLYRELGDRKGMANTLNNMGWDALLVGEDERAVVLLEESLMLCRDLHDPDELIYPLSSLGITRVQRGEYSQAHALLVEGLQLLQQLGNMEHLLYYLLGFAWLATPEAAVQGHPREGARRAARLLGAAETLSVAQGVPLARVLLSAEWTLHTAHVTYAWERIDPTLWAAAWRKGHAMVLEHAIAYALDDEKR